MQPPSKFQVFVENDKLTLKFIWKYKGQDTRRKVKDMKIYSSGYKELLQSYKN